PRGQPDFFWPRAPGKSRKVPESRKLSTWFEAAVPLRSGHLAGEHPLKVANAHSESSRRQSFIWEHSQMTATWQSDSRTAKAPRLHFGSSWTSKSTRVHVNAVDREPERSGRMFDSCRGLPDEDPSERRRYWRLPAAIR